MASIQTKKHFVEDNTNRPDIGFTVVLITAKHLRGHVKWRPQHSLGELFVGEKFGETEICDLYLAIMHENIGQFKISVHNLVFGESFEGVEYLYEKLEGFLLVDGFVFFQVLGKVALVAILEYEVKVVCSFFDVIQLYDIFVVAST